MIVAVQGTNGFNDYPVFMRAMGVAMSGMGKDDKEFYDLSERGMKARGKKIKFFKVPTSWIKENIEIVDYFAFLSTPKEPVSSLVAEAELKDIEVGIFRY